MSLVPSPHTVMVRRRVLVAEDAHGNEEWGWSDPQPWRVRSIDPGQSAEPFLPNRDLSSVKFALHADVSPDVPSRVDEVQVDPGGDWLPVDGDPADWSLGPWPNPVAGVIVLLKAVNG